jgi:hypothetical protein
VRDGDGIVLLTASEMQTCTTDVLDLLSAGGTAKRDRRQPRLLDVAALVELGPAALAALQEEQLCFCWVAPIITPCTKLPRDDRHRSVAHYASRDPRRWRCNNLLEIAFGRWAEERGCPHTRHSCALSGLTGVV